MTLLTLPEEQAFTKIDKKEANITVVGMGKMGLPMALVFTNAGYQVTGYDISENTVDQLNKGVNILPNEEGVDERLQDAIANNLFNATTDVGEAVSNADFIIIIIPVLTDKNDNQDLEDLLETYELLSEYAPKGVTYIQESTLAPGTTSGIIKETLEQQGDRSGIDFGLVFSPERTFSGRVIKDIEENYPKIIGGDTENAAKMAATLYETVSKESVITVTNASTAEAVKTFKGAYRDANIAIANQFAILADRYGVDVIEVINAANTEPFSHIHTPGIGVGGHCIPVYPQFIITGGRERGYEPDVLIKSREANQYMVPYAIEVMSNHMDLENSDILVMGLSYRGGVKEYRHSPALNLVPELRGKGVNVTLTDPLYTNDEIDTLFGSGTGLDWSSVDFSNFNGFVIVTDHDEFEGLEPQFHEKVVFDGRYMLDFDEADNFTLLQPGRLIQSKYENTKP